VATQIALMLAAVGALLGAAVAGLIALFGG
jgi:hypothetical protein